MREVLSGTGVTMVLSEPDVDSDGRNALRVTVVLEPGTADQITGKSLVDVLIRLDDDVQKAGEERFPLIDYTTKEEVEASGRSQSDPPVRSGR